MIVNNDRQSGLYKLGKIATEHQIECSVLIYKLCTHGNGSNHKID